MLALTDCRVGRRRIVAIALCLALAHNIVAASGAAFAADATDLDQTAAGSITVTLADADDDPVAGGSLMAYKVASLEKNTTALYYAATADFSECSDDIAAITADLDSGELAELADSFAAYAVEQDLVGTSLAVDDDGVATMTDIDLGLYLIVQVKALSAYGAVSPFFVTVPMNVDGVWNYDVDAQPKVGPLNSIEANEDDPDDGSADQIETSAADSVSSGGKVGLSQTGDDLSVLVAAGCCICVVAALTAACARKALHK